MTVAPRWRLRSTSDAQRERYRADGYWSDATLGDLVEQCLSATPQSTINVWSETRPWSGTYADAHRDALQLVTALQRAGLQPGATVAFQLPNWHEAVVAFYGLALGGYILVPIVHIYGHKEVRFILAQSGANAYISADRFGHVDYLDTVDGAPEGDLPDLVVHVVVSTSGAAVPGASNSRVNRCTWTQLLEGCAPIEASQLPRGDAQAVCVLAYTSGTTSDPKGVIHSHESLLAELVHMGVWITPRHPNLMGSPVTHATGMLGAVLGPMRVGQPIHIIDRWDPTRVLEIMLEASVGAGTGASVFLASVVDHPNFTEAHGALLRRVGLGGAPVPLALAERAARRGASIIRAYGSTEHPSITGCSFDDPIDKRHSTDGPPMPGVEIKIVDDDGQRVPAGRAGEIWSRGPDLCIGYTDPTLFDRAFDADGWYHTEDMGVADAEGYVTITDRLKDIVIRGGENISAAEVEEVIASHPAVAEVAVVAAPDARLGEHACAFVRLAPDDSRAALAGVDLAAIAAHLDTMGLARQKWPEELRIVVDFPRTPSGKIRKVELRQQLRDEAQ